MSALIIAITLYSVIRGKLSVYNPQDSVCPRSLLEARKAREQGLKLTLDYIVRRIRVQRSKSMAW